MRISDWSSDVCSSDLGEVEDEQGRKGFDDGHISPGSSSETRDGGWQFCLARIDQILGMAAEDAKALILSRFEESKVATTALVAALEVLQDNAQLEIPEDVELPLLTPINTMDPEDIAAEVETWLAEGFRTFKVKVGKDVEIGRAHVLTPVTNAHLVCRLLLEKKKK